MIMGKPKTATAAMVAIFALGFCIGRLTAPGSPPPEGTDPQLDLIRIEPLPDEIFCPLIEVIDGNTIVVEYEGEEEQVRLIDVDSPAKGEPGYEEAAQTLKELLAGKDVLLEFDPPGKPQRDDMGRLVAQVFIKRTQKPVNVNVEMTRRSKKGWDTADPDALNAGE